MVPSDSPLTATGPTELSVIVPFYNEAPNVAPVLAELRATLAAMRVRAEVVAIDDGSRDETKAELARVRSTWPELNVISFLRNRGQAAALWEGFHQSRGQWIAMLDGDGQNPPAEIAQLWEVRDSADMIAGVRAQRRDSALRRSMSRLANAVRRVALHDGVTDSGCSLKLFRRPVADAFIPLRTMYSFLPAFAVAGGWSVRELPVAHRPRTAGESKYGLRAMAVMPFLDTLALAWILRRTFVQKPT